jgi:hypothetical protein
MQAGFAGGEDRTPDTEQKRQRAGQRCSLPHQCKQIPPSHKRQFIAAG